MIDQVIEALQPPAMVVAEDYRIQLVNKAFSEFCGAEKEELIGQRCHWVCHGNITPCQLDTTPCPLREVFRTGKAFSIKHIHRCKDGEERVFEIQASPVISPDTGKVEGMLEIMVETGESPEDLRRLQTAEEFLQSVLEGIAEGVVVISHDLRIIRANKYYQKMCGMTEKELQGQFCYEASHRYDVPCFEKGEDCPVIKSLKTGTRKSATHVHYDSKGNPIYVELNAFPLRDFRSGGIAAVLETINDVTERVRLQERLRKTESLYRDLYNSTPVMLFTLNDEGIITECNRTMAEKLVYKKQELKGSLFSSLLTEESKKLFERQKTLCEPHKVCVLEVEMLSSEGRRVPVKLTGRKIVEGNRTYYSMTGQDISELKKAEQEKKLLEAQLFQAQKLESLGTLSAGIAHDFNNILTGLIGYTELLAKFNLPSEGKKYITRMTELLNIASNLTKQLLIVGRKAETEYEVFDLGSFVNDFLSTIRRIIGDDIEIKAILPVEEITIKGDTSQIYQMLMNLFINARDAMPEGGTITVRLAKDNISSMGIYHHTDINEYAVISIKDTGTGIPDEIKERIFDPFFTTKTDRTNKGTGLGLSVVYSIVKAHKGKIEVYSSPGKGAEFRVYLPLCYEDRQVKEQPEQREEKGSSIKNSTVLIVDDEEMILDILSTVLEQAGLEVIRAQSGLRAIEILRNYEGHIALAIVDLSMPRLNGVETFKELKKIDPNLKVVLSTGYSSEKKDEYLKMGFAGCLQKPYKINDLLEKIKELL